MSQSYQLIEEKVVLNPYYDELIVSFYVPIEIENYCASITVKHPYHRSPELSRRRNWIIQNKLDSLPTTTTIDHLLDDSRSIPPKQHDVPGGLPVDNLYPRPRATPNDPRLPDKHNPVEPSQQDLWLDIHKKTERTELNPADYIECIVGEVRTTLVRNQPMKLLKEGYLKIEWCNIIRVHTTNEKMLLGLDVQTSKLNLFSEQDRNWVSRYYDSTVLYGVVKKSSLKHLTPILEDEYEMLHASPTRLYY